MRRRICHEIFLSIIWKVLRSDVKSRGTDMNHQFSISSLIIKKKPSSNNLDIVKIYLNISVHLILQNKWRSFVFTIFIASQLGKCYCLNVIFSHVHTFGSLIFIIVVIKNEGYYRASYKLSGKEIWRSGRIVIKSTVQKPKDDNAHI